MQIAREVATSYRLGEEVLPKLSLLHVFIVQNVPLLVFLLSLDCRCSLLCDI